MLVRAGEPSSVMAPGTRFARRTPTSLTPRRRSSTNQSGFPSHDSSTVQRTTRMAARSQQNIEEPVTVAIVLPSWFLIVAVKNPARWPILSGRAVA